MAKVESLNLAHVDEIVDLKAALEACENKWYNKSFADAEKFVEPIVHQARFHGFGEGWLAALQAMVVPEDSPLRNLKQMRLTPMWRLSISRSPTTSMPPKMKKSSNHQLRMSQTSKLIMQSISRLPILQFDAYVFSLLLFFVHV